MCLVFLYVISMNIGEGGGGRENKPVKVIDVTHHTDKRRRGPACGPAHKLVYTNRHRICAQKQLVVPPVYLRITCMPVGRVDVG